MGCDIHCYIEYKPFERTWRDWSPFGSRINPGRDYLLFGVLAGVRGEAPAEISPRGLPEDVAYQAQYDNILYIRTDAEEKMVGEHETTADRAAYYVNTCGSKYLYHRDCTEPYAVTHPDWHSRSWLTVTEFAAALKRRQMLEREWPIGVEYKAVLAAMRELAKGKCHVRIVFWFDN